MFGNILVAATAAKERPVRATDWLTDMCDPAQRAIASNDAKLELVRPEGLPLVLMTDGVLGQIFFVDNSPEKVGLCLEPLSRVAGDPLAGWGAVQVSPSGLTQYSQPWVLSATIWYLVSDSSGEYSTVSL